MPTIGELLETTESVNRYVAVEDSTGTNTNKLNLNNISGPSGWNTKYWVDQYFGSTEAAQGFFKGTAAGSGNNTGYISVGSGNLDGVLFGGVVLSSNTASYSGYYYSPYSGASDYFGLISKKFVAVFKPIDQVNTTVKLGWWLERGHSIEIIDGVIHCKSATSPTTETITNTGVVLTSNVGYIFEVIVSASGEDCTFTVRDAITSTVLINITHNINDPAYMPIGSSYDVKPWFRAYNTVDGSPSTLGIIYYLGLGNI